MNTQIEQDRPADNAAKSEDTAPTLTAIECRVLGALMEKQLSTPDNYPLTISSLLSAANQKSNREPVTNYQQGELTRTLRQLEERRFVRYEMGARSERYEQRFTSASGFSKKQQALLSVMMLRGPQTVNELETRTQRLYQYTDRNDMVVSLERLTQGDSPAVVVIPPQAGQREERYGQIFCGDIDVASVAAVSDSTPISRQSSGAEMKGSAEIEGLQAEVEVLRSQLQKLYDLTGHAPEEGSDS